LYVVPLGSTSGWRNPIRLLEDEDQRRHGQCDRRECRLPFIEPARPVCDEAGEEEDDQDLPELRGLEVEASELDPALRSADVVADDENDQEEKERDAIEHTAETPIGVGVDRSGDGERDRAEDHVDALADEVEVRLAGDVMARDVGEDPQTVGDDSADDGEQEIVEMAQEGADLGGQMRANGLFDSGSH
jgi:hypothetical protein